MMTALGALLRRLGAKNVSISRLILEKGISYRVLGLNGLRFVV